MDQYELLPANIVDRSINKKYITKNKNVRKWNGKNLIPVCLHENCLTQSFFAHKGDLKPEFCSKHKKDGMINIVSKTCAHEGCGKIPKYGHKGETSAKFCKKHKEDTMVDIKHKKCEYEECNKHPSFANKGETSAKFCKNHKKAGMIDVINKRCEYIGCEKKACCSKGKGFSVKFCAKHKEADMIDVYRKTCAHKGCGKIPNYANKGESAKFCKDHKDHKMIDVKNKKCEHENCEKQASCSKGKGFRAKFCAKHKEPGMIDVINKKCQCCSTSASYGIPGQPPSLCFTHGKNKEGFMKHPSRKCSKCNNTAVYGIKNPIHCELHKTSDEQNLCLIKCKNCNAIEICNKDQICFEYCINSEIHKRLSHFRELRIKTLLETKIEVKFTSFDKILDTSCNLRRPDIYYDLGDKGLVIEIDENQHKSYTENCEIMRMKQIFFSIGLPKTVFIRYNSDKFTGKYSNISNFDREKILIEQINYYISLKDEEKYSIKILYLFYDDFDISNMKIKYIDPYKDNYIQNDIIQKPVIENEFLNSLSFKTVKQLIQICKDYKIRGYSGKRKAEIIELIKSKV